MGALAWNEQREYCKNEIHEMLDKETEATNKPSKVFDSQL